MENIHVISASALAFSVMVTLTLVLAGLTILFWRRLQQLQSGLGRYPEFDPLRRPMHKPQSTDKDVLFPRDDDLVVEYSVVRG